MPQLRDWVKERFGGTGQTLLDESVYGDQELRTDLRKLEINLEKLENDMDKHGRRYKRLLQEGANASELERKKFAQKAKFEKKKYAIKKKKYRADSVKYGTLLSIQGMREIADLHDDEVLEFDTVLEDADAQAIQHEIVERMAMFGVEMEDLQEIQQALDIPIMDDELELDVGEEEEIMRQLEREEISTDEVDIAAEPDLGEPSDIDVSDVEIDEFGEPELEI